MITYYKCRPGKGIQWHSACLPTKHFRWTVQIDGKGRKSLTAEDAVEIRDTLRKDTQQTLKGIAEEIGVSPDFLKAMLAAHGQFLNFYHRKDK